MHIKLHSVLLIAGHLSGVTSPYLAVDPCQAEENSLGKYTMHAFACCALFFSHSLWITSSQSALQIWLLPQVSPFPWLNHRRKIWYYYKQQSGIALAYSWGLKTQNCMDVIEENNPKDINVCQRKMFKAWLKITPSPSYQQLVEALYTVGEISEADRLCKKYGKTWLCWKLNMFGRWIISYWWSFILGIQWQHSEVGEGPPAKKNKTDWHSRQNWFVTAPHEYLTDHWMQVMLVLFLPLLDSLIVHDFIFCMLICTLNC